MPLRLKESDWRALFPRAPDAIIDAFVAHADELDEAGITETRTRLAYALANVEHECGGYALRGLTENIRYTPERLAVVFPKRFASADAVRARYGTAPGWQKAAFNDIYGNRMGNRPGSDDGSRYIGRGGPQITGRGGYREIGARCGLDLVNQPDLACKAEHQPALLAAFWAWKELNAVADKGDFIACVKKWNGGTNGLKDRREAMKGNDPIIQRLTRVTSVLPQLDRVEHAPA